MPCFRILYIPKVQTNYQVFQTDAGPTLAHPRPQSKQYRKMVQHSTHRDSKSWAAKVGVSKRANSNGGERERDCGSAAISRRFRGCAGVAGQVRRSGRWGGIIPPIIGGRGGGGGRRNGCGGNGAIICREEENTPLSDFLFFHFLATVTVKNVFRDATDVDHNNYEGCLL